MPKYAGLITRFFKYKNVSPATNKKKNIKLLFFPKKFYAIRSNMCENKHGMLDFYILPLKFKFTIKNLPLKIYH